MRFIHSGTDIPTTVLVGPHLYEVRLEDGLCHETDEPLLGLCLSDELVIKLERKQPPSLMRETLLHEVIHAIAHQWSLEDEATEEQWASAVGVGLLQVFMHNPEFYRWLDPR